MFEEIRKLSFGKFAVFFAMALFVFYFALKEFILPALMSSSLGVRLAKERLMDTEYRDRVLKQMYDSYLRKMAGSE